MYENFENIYGTRTINEAIAHNVPVSEICVGNYVNLSQNKAIEQILRSATSQNIKISKVDKSLLDKWTKSASHQGIVAKVKAFEYASLQDIIVRAKDKAASLIVVLDHIEDAGNLGAIARSAEAFSADGLVIANKRAATVNASTYKTSAGAIFNLPIAKVANINAAIEKLKQNDYWIAAASEHAQNNIWDENLKGKLVLIMGGEHDGVSSLVLKNSDYQVKLPLSGNTESLNVAQAATACIYEWVRQNA